MRPLIWIILFIFICPQPLLGLVLERGQASICTQHRTLRSEVESFESTQRETDTIFSLWQDSINYGRLEGKFVLSNIDGHWEEGSYTLGIKDFWITNKIGMNTFLGDNNLYYRTIPVFFTNYQIPLAFLRGISSKIGSDRWNTQIIAGKLLERKGITGNAFEQTHESLYGLKFGLELPRKSFLGGGFLRTEGEEDTLGKLIIKKNNLFIIDNYCKIENLMKHDNIFRCVYRTRKINTSDNYIFITALTHEELVRKILKMSSLVFIVYKHTEENWQELIRLITYKKRILIYLTDRKKSYYIKDTFDLVRIFNKPH